VCHDSYISVASALLVKDVGSGGHVLAEVLEADLEDLPEEIRQDMSFVFAETVQDVLDAALDTNAQPAVTVNAITGRAGIEGELPESHPLGVIPEAV